MEYITIMVLAEQSSKRLLFQLYYTQGGGKVLLFLSPAPLFDFNYLASKGYERFLPVIPPLPLGITAPIFYDLRSEICKKGLPSVLSLDKIRALCCRELRRRGFPNEYGVLSEFSVPNLNTIPGGEDIREVESLLKGRLLSLKEIQRFTGILGKENITQILQILCLEGKAALLPALYQKKGSVVCCQRCGWEGIPVQQTCARCGSSQCCSCPDCGLLGSLSFCDALYSATEYAEENGISCTPLELGTPAVKKPPSRRAPTRKVCRWKLPGDIRFTPPQEAAAELLQQFGKREEPGGTCLVWAACGAGKTEVSFPLIADTLSHGERVLFASPRRDVVIELAPRLARAFGEKRVAALYGGSGSKKDLPLVVATTHQVLRFYHCFDLVILDEGDAFPFPESRMLHFGVEKARRPGGKLVYLTATPTSWMLAKAKKSRVDIIKIPARPHGFPLPVPKFLKIKPLQKTKRGYIIHQRVLEIIAELLKRRGSRIFLFVPAVALTSIAGEALRSATGKYPFEQLKPDSIQWVHAGDRDRKLKRERFFAGEFPLLVTTTIMERGVTVPRVNVLVLDAAQEGIFDTSTLVQIAGRCGRSPDYPTGDVWFISQEISRSMREARAQIMGMNKQAQRRGYLRKDWEDELNKIVL